MLSYEKKTNISDFKVPLVHHDTSLINIILEIQRLKQFPLPVCTELYTMTTSGKFSSVAKNVRTQYVTSENKKCL